MIRHKRKLTLDIYDYGGNKICPLYDSNAETEGQAADVYVTKERNGWKELNFTLPGDDFRAQYVRADYKIKLIDDDGADWFLITSPKVTHEGHKKNINVNAGHVSQLLKTKNLDLEFSDDYGNNVGTAAQLLATVLEGTGWSVGDVADFLEKDGSTIKVRTLKASTKTGAFKLISMIADLFEAKPVYHGEERTVDLLPMNPFSHPANGDIYTAVTNYADGKVLELNYGRNVTNISRQLKTENINTKLRVRGSYGDTTTGYCGIDECEHTEHMFVLTDDLTAETQYYFTVQDDAGVNVSRNFTPPEDVESGTLLIWSCLDPASMMYVWNNGDSVAYRVQEGAHGTELPAEHTSEKSQNWFSFLMDFTYYDESGLLSDEMLQTIAAFQRNGVEYLEATHTAATDYAESWLNLSQTIGEIDFVKLDVANVSYETIDSNNYAKLTLTDKRIVYRTDNDATEYFKWRAATALKDNGDPINTEASAVYAIHATNPTTYDKFYIKSLNDEDNPSVLILWADANEVRSTDKFYLFSYDGVNGYLGAYEAADEALTEALDSATTVVTVNHPVFYTTIRPGIVNSSWNTDTNSQWLQGIDTPKWATYNKTYAWWYNYDEGVLYFCYYADGDRSWNRVYVTETEPAYAQGCYWYNWKTSVLSRGTGGTWTALSDPDDATVTSLFGTVYWSCLNKDKYRIGEYAKYTVEGSFIPANWYMTNEYGTLWLFTTEESATKFEYDTTNGTLTFTPSNTAHAEDTVAVKAHRHDNVMYHSANIFANATYETGAISDTTGGDLDGSSYASYNRSYSLPVYPNLTYQFSGINGGAKLYFYTLKHDFISCASVTLPRAVTIPNNTRYIRVTSTESLNALDAHIPEYATAVIANDETYYYAGASTGSGLLKGLVPLVDSFWRYADATYITYYDGMSEAQANYAAYENAMKNALGDLIREGDWQDNNYVDGDEQKLYEDALDNLKQVAKPETIYTINFLDQRCTDIDAIQENGVRWADFDVNDAAHVIDTELGINQWAYIDKVTKYYDAPWKTTLTINTNLTSSAQHSFTDVISNIANVASQAKAKDTIYSRASALNGSGKLATEKLEGVIDANKLKITGGSSTWYTDENGNMVFESADGQSAMMISGNGFAISNARDKYGDWIFRSFGSGQGFSADELVTGTLSAKLIEAGGITTDHISSTFGESLNLTSNKSINLKVAGLKQELEDEIADIEAPGLNDIDISDTAPADPELNHIWLDTSSEPYIYRRWDGTSWVTMRANESQLNQTSSSIELLVNELWGNQVNSSSRVSVNSDNISSLSQTVDGHTTSISQNAEAISTNASGISGLDTRVTQTESAITSIATDASGARTVAQQTADKLSWVVQGNSQAEMTLTQDALTYIGNNIDLSANNSFSVTVGALDDAITTVQQGAVASTTVLYALGTSSTTAPSDGWSATAPAWEEGKYTWQKTRATYLNGTTSDSAPVCLTTATGGAGQPGEDATTLRIESSRGTVFKRDDISTVLSVVIYHGSQRITDITALHTVFGSSAYLQWKWRRRNDSSYGTISSSDSRISDSGFTFTVTAADVDANVTFMCELITD